MYCPNASRFGRNAWTNDERQAFLDGTISLRKKLNGKRFEYREMSRKPGVSNEQLAALEKEIIDIRTKIRNKADKVGGGAQ